MLRGSGSTEAPKVVQCGRTQGGRVFPSRGIRAVLWIARRVWLRELRQVVDGALSARRLHVAGLVAARTSDRTVRGPIFAGCDGIRSCPREVLRRMLVTPVRPDRLVDEVPLFPSCGSCARCGFCGSSRGHLCDGHRRDVWVCGRRGRSGPRGRSCAVLDRALCISSALPSEDRRRARLCLRVKGAATEPGAIRRSPVRGMKMRPRAPSGSRITVRALGSRGLRENATWAGRFRRWA